MPRKKKQRVDLPQISFRPSSPGILRRQRFFKKPSLRFILAVTRLVQPIRNFHVFLSLFVSQILCPFQPLRRGSGYRRRRRRRRSCRLCLMPLRHCYSLALLRHYCSCEDRIESPEVSKSVLEFDAAREGNDGEEARF